MTFSSQAEINANVELRKLALSIAAEVAVARGGATGEEVRRDAECLWGFLVDLSPGGVYQLPVAAGEG